MGDFAHGSRMVSHFLSIRRAPCDVTRGSRREPGAYSAEICMMRTQTNAHGEWITNGGLTLAIVREQGVVSIWWRSDHGQEGSGRADYREVPRPSGPAVGSRLALARPALTCQDEGECQGE